MLAIKLWNYLKGYVIIKVEGLTLERFVNLATNNDIYLWDIVRIDYTTIEGKVSIIGFKSLKEIVKKVGCRVYIVEKNGLPFLVEKLKKRKMFAFGFLLFIGLIFLFTSFIWNIEVTGNERISIEEIDDFLKSINIQTGKIKYSIDVENLKNSILDKYDTLSFVSVEIKGTKLFIEVKEQDLPPEKIEFTTPCNIIAKKKGIINKIIAKNGKQVVNEGDIVEKGQLLISGVIVDEMLEDSLLLHAEGEVLAITRYTKTVEEPIEKEVKEETGKVIRKKEIKIGEKGISFIEGKIPFMEYIVVEETKNLFNTLPIKIITHEYREVKVISIKQNIDSLKSSSQVTAIEELKKILPENSKILSKDVKYSIQGNNFITVLVLEVIEDIGEKQIIDSWED